MTPPGLCRWWLPCLCLALAQCAKPPDARPGIVSHYVTLAAAVYGDALAGAQNLDAAVSHFLAAPNAENLNAARAAWRQARVAYSQSEVFRFGNYLVDDWEPRVNAWPIDEGLIDYVDQGYAASDDNPAARANLIASDTLRLGAQTLDTRELSPGVLRQFNELGGIESNVTVGYHAIEFLLWGQDRGVAAASRPWTDYALDSAACSDGDKPAGRPQNCRKRGAYLRSLTQLLVLDLEEMTLQWGPAPGSYGSRLQREPVDVALHKMLLGMGSLAQQELAGERIEVALLTHAAEEEQDCFSDDTHHSLFNNALGVENIYLGRYRRSDGSELHGASLADAVAAARPELDRQLRHAFGEARRRLQQIVSAADTGQKFDQLIAHANTEGAALLRQAVTALRAETELIEQIAVALKLPAVENVPAASLSGGATTLLKTSPSVELEPDSFSRPASNLPLAQRGTFAVGNSVFTSAWVRAPASAAGRDGLGPLYNAVACQNCHLRDGRGYAPDGADEPLVSALLRLSTPGAADARMGMHPEPRYGIQIQNRALPGIAAEARVRVRWQESSLPLPEGGAIALRRPRIELDQLAYGPLAETAHLSLRVAQPMIGLGLLEAIADKDLLARADPDDHDQDGISGRINQVWDRKRNTTVTGRFGWKAAQPSLRQQAALALSEDIGISSSLFPDGNCTIAQAACRGTPDGGKPELDEALLDAIEFYSRHLAVPARRWVNEPQVLKGERLFKQIGCASCHTPDAVTDEVPDRPALSRQVIHPYTDLLLHDMGAGLADSGGEFEASGSDWRTPPLWGLHLTQAVGQRTQYLHDGRARSLLEAIAWHGGEAAAARDKVLALAPAQRDDLIWFLKSL